MLVLNDTIPKIHCSICYADDSEDTTFEVVNDKCFCIDCYNEIKKRCEWLDVTVEEAYKLFK